MPTTYFAENVKIKRILEDIINNAFPNSPKLDEYKKFYIKITDKNVKSYAGVYNRLTKTIEIVGLDRQSKHILITCLHELSHHIDTCNRNKSDHSADFYDIYAKLIYSGLNMRLFTPNDITMEDVTDGNKVRKIVDDWRPNMVDYKSGYSIISVYNCFNQKDELKKNAYRYNAMAKTWEKEISNAAKDNELEFLKTLDIKPESIKIAGANDINIEKKLKIEATGDTYAYKDKLKDLGFYYKDKKWYRSCNTGDDVKELISMYQRQIPDLKFVYKA